VAQDEGGSAVVVQQVESQGSQIACRWCGLFSSPGPACELCGSPLADIPSVQVSQLTYRVAEPEPGPAIKAEPPPQPDPLPQALAPAPSQADVAEPAAAPPPPAAPPPQPSGPRIVWTPPAPGGLEGPDEWEEAASAALEALSAVEPEVVAPPPPEVVPQPPAEADVRPSGPVEAEEPLEFLDSLAPSEPEPEPDQPEADEAPPPHADTQAKALLARLWPRRRAEDLEFPAEDSAETGTEPVQPPTEPEAEAEDLLWEPAPEETRTRGRLVGTEPFPDRVPVDGATGQSALPIGQDELKPAAPKRSSWWRRARRADTPPVDQEPGEEEAPGVAPVLPGQVPLVLDAMEEPEARAERETHAVVPPGPEAETKPTPSASDVPADAPHTPPADVVEEEAAGQNRPRSTKWLRLRPVERHPAPAEEPASEAPAPTQAQAPAPTPPPIAPAPTPATPAVPAVAPAPAPPAAPAVRPVRPAAGRRTPASEPGTGVAARAPAAPAAAAPRPPAPVTAPPVTAPQPPRQAPVARPRAPRPAPPPPASAPAPLTPPVPATPPATTPASPPVSAPDATPSAEAGPMEPSDIWAEWPSRSAPPPTQPSEAPSSERFVSWDALAWTPEASPRSLQAGEQKRSRLPWKRSKKQPSSNGFSSSPSPQPSLGGASGAPAISADPLYQPGGSSLQRPAQAAAPQQGQEREIFCPRCGQPSPRGLCEPCEDALTQLRQLTVALSEGFEEIGT